MGQPPRTEPIDLTHVALGLAFARAQGLINFLTDPGGYLSVYASGREDRLSDAEAREVIRQAEVEAHSSGRESAPGAPGDAALGRRRTIVAASDLADGDVFSLDDAIWHCVAVNMVPMGTVSCYVSWSEIRDEDADTYRVPIGALQKVTVLR